MQLIQVGEDIFEYCIIFNNWENKPSLCKSLPKMQKPYYVNH